MYTGHLGTVSNREDWQQSIDVVDDSGDAVDISSAQITLAVRGRGAAAPILTADQNDCIAISSPRFTFAFEAAKMRALCPGQYDVGCVVALGGVTTQLIVGTVNVVDGVVS
jgi:hypothetical protein